MKKTFIALSLVALTVSSLGLRAQDKATFTPYGFFRSYGIFDSRMNKAGSEDLFYYLPMDRNIDATLGSPTFAKDLNAVPSFKMYAITSRFGFNMKGYKIGSADVTGKVEADFYCMNGSTATLRLRQAFANFAWVGAKGNKTDLKVGQAWHPMAADMPYAVNIESGSPFSPFARSPQVMVDAQLGGGFTLTAGILYPMQYQPTGPAGASENYAKYALVPEAYAGISYASGDFLARLGADVITLKPRYQRVSDRITMVTPMLYFQYKYDTFKINAKTVLASGGDHMRLMGGYALYDTSDPLNFKYTPLRNSSSFVSVSYGSKIQVMGMVGYMKALGTAHDLPLNPTGSINPDNIYYFSSGFKNLNQLVRFTPTVAYNVGKLTVALEDDNTIAEYGDITSMNAKALCTKDKHLIINHRILTVFKLSF